MHEMLNRHGRTFIEKKKQKRSATSLIVGGKDSKFLHEILGERAGGGETELKCDLLNIKLTFGKHLTRHLESDGTDKFSRCLAGYLLDFLIEMHARHSDVGGQFLDGEVGTAHVLLDISGGFVDELRVERCNLELVRFGVDEVGHL